MSGWNSRYPSRSSTMPRPTASSQTSSARPSPRMVVASSRSTSGISARIARPVRTVGSRPRQSSSAKKSYSSSGSSASGCLASGVIPASPTTAGHPRARAMRPRPSAALVSPSTSFTSSAVIARATSGTSSTSPERTAAAVAQEGLRAPATSSWTGDRETTVSTNASDAVEAARCW